MEAIPPCVDIDVFNEILKHRFCLKSSIEEPPILELKLLPSHLKYSNLKDNETLLLIISSNSPRNKREGLKKLFLPFICIKS